MATTTPRVWLVTGSSSGLGLAMCKHALSQGDKVVATLRTPSDIDDLKNQYTPDVLLVAKLDVTQTDDILAAFRTAKKRFGRVDVVFNNAGVALVGEVEGVPEHAARAQMDVKFWGITAVSKEAVRFFRDENPTRGGLLLNISSELGIRTMPLLGHYAAAKHAMEGLTQTLRSELDPAWNIKVCLVAPGAFSTNAGTKPEIVPIPDVYRGVTASKDVREFTAVVQESQGPANELDAVAKKIFEFSMSSDIPMRLFLGDESIQRVRKQIADMVEDLNASKAWSEGLIEDECIVL
ncbi:SDR family oxidoreductase [Phanerochaete sordida]|uniref:SDR family oxidoreductase n=1 Tax=Phanerochaete sordida TaxID=48140 RepID=A0A9P3LDM1_9APHY|nr:SDR family oxidoreductase [Phanerochaete sordida]